MRDVQTRGVRHLRFPGRVVDLVTRELRREGAAPVRLTAQEARLLARLAATPDAPVSRRELLVEVWGYHPESRSRAPDVAVHRLRAKLEDDPAQPAFLFTVLGQGWVLRGTGLSVQGTTVSAGELVGREALVVEVVEALEDAGQLCLVGPPGVGKTALAQVVLAGLPREVLRVELAGARDEGALFAAVAWALRLPMGGVGDLAAHLGGLLSERGSLLWLDAPEAVAGALGRWLEAWRLRALVSSRVAVPGLARREVPPLTLDEAEGLFRRLAPGVEAAAARRVLDGLDGLPLAIRLAAARARQHGVAALLGEEGVRLERVEAAGEDSLAEAIARSWRLLGPRQRAVLRCLAPLAEPFDLETAEALAPPGEPWVGEVLTELAGASLVLVEGGPRYRLLESVRWFVETQGGELGPPDLDRLVDWARSGRAGWPTLRGVIERVRRLRPHRLDELVLALDEAQQEELALPLRRELLQQATGPGARHRLAWVAFLAGEPGALGALAALQEEAAGSPLGDRSLLRLARARRAQARPSAGELAELRAALDRALAPELRVAILRELSEQHADRREFLEARLALKQALAVQGATSARGAILCALGHLALVQERPDDGLEAVAEALRLEGGGVLGERAWRTLGGLRFHAGDLDGAIVAWEHARALSAELGLWRQHAVSLGNLGAAYAELGHLADARQVMEEALARSRELSQAHTEVPNLLNLGQLALLEGDLAEGQALLEGALRAAGTAGWTHLVLQARLGLAVATQLGGRPAGGELAAVLAEAEATGSLREADLARAHLALEGDGDGGAGSLRRVGAMDRRLLGRAGEALAGRSS